MELLASLDPVKVGKFLISAVALTLAPGPDNLMVLGLGLARGRLEGILFGAGCALGTLVHTLLATLGISALIVASPAAFTGLKIAGAAYLAWLGIQVLRHARDPARGRTNGVPVRRLGVFLKGMGAAAVNPKLVVFFLAFLPQFIVPAHGEVWFQTLVLGVLFGLQGGLVLALIGYFAGTLGRRMASDPRLVVGLNVLAGLVFLTLALNLAVDLVFLAIA
ncbi:LysE family translocator [Phaeovibrio sulfidiphilus]|uniref:LysE family translocator n=1 Tax=Phaeovibrio sulfidiphilus TaxID=1220600 RepID=A0A8J6YVM7_9PROT|nr:LysE family translocator [Phaeovibrio sulfidiphilus]MBE1236567.1 LysE family translocator [Phaeovibrio sulfidiphilus]